MTEVASTTSMRPVQRHIGSCSLTEVLRISSCFCSLGSHMLLLTSLITSYWVIIRTPLGLLHAGLWETCIGSSCSPIDEDIPEYLYVARAFLVMALLCGIVSLVCILITLERESFRQISFTVLAGVLSFTTGFFTIISISVVTAVYRSKDKYLQDLMIFGSSYKLCWASIPAYITTGIVIMVTYRMSRRVAAGA